jgi:UDP-glucose 4-epimerase
MVVLVTGGAGYIGSILTEQMINQGHRVIVVDNLSRGHRAAVVPEAFFIQADLNDQQALDDIFRNYRIDFVMHLAACTSVEQSMKEPGRYFRNNVSCGINLLDCMIKHGVKHIVFSSSAAVYGEPEEAPVSEDSPLNPVNAYGDSKLVFERILRWYGESYGLKYISLRYFNVAGASQRFGADHHPETNLIPIVVRAALGDIEYLPVFGDDYNTRDGTCVRDYINVLDIARAHIMALVGFGEGLGNRVYNLGNGEGFSVMEVIKTARKVTGAAIPIKVCPRRPGDPAVLVADYRRAKEYIGWEPENSLLENIIRSAWLWQKEHPQGYNDAW